MINKVRITASLYGWKAWVSRIDNCDFTFDFRKEREGKVPFTISVSGRNTKEIGAELTDFIDHFEPIDFALQCLGSLGKMPLSDFIGMVGDMDAIRSELWLVAFDLTHSEPESSTSLLN